jgi:hypothetical protein
MCRTIAAINQIEISMVGFQDCTINMRPVLDPCALPSHLGWHISSILPVANTQVGRAKAGK